MACQLDFVHCQLKHILLRTHISETGFIYKRWRKPAQLYSSSLAHTVFMRLEVLTLVNTEKRPSTVLKCAYW